MIPFNKIKKQLLSDPEILDHFIMTEFDIIDDIKLQVIITNEENDIEIDEEEAEVIAKKYYENNKEEIQNVIREYFNYIMDSDNWMRNINFNEDDLLKQNSK
jgi:hypothetical protein